MQNSPIDLDLVKYLKKLEARISVVENRRPGTIYLDKKIVTKDPVSGVETVIGDLSEYGEDRMGIKQFINDVEPPPIPTSPMVVSTPGLFTVSWDGANRDNLPHAPDFDHLNVYGSDGTSTILVGSIKNKEEVAVVPTQDYNVKWNFWMTSVDQNGNESAPSNQSPDVISTPLSDAPDIAGAISDVILKIEEESAKAMTAANGKNRIWSSPTEPVLDPKVPFIEGDTWFDTDDGNKIYIWKTSPAPAGWKPAVLDSSALDAKVNNLINTAKTQSDTAIQTANGKNRAYHQNTAPTGTGHTVGDLWFDTANDNRLSKWDGSKWVVSAIGSKAISDVVINSISAAQNAATAAKQSADGKNTNYYATTAPTAPTGGFKSGDVWFNTADGNRSKVWSGTQWVDTSSNVPPSVVQDIQTAKGRADEAFNLANGKNKRVDSDSNPPATTAGYIPGDRWLKWSNMGTTGALLQSWTVKGSAWVLDTMDASYLPKVDIGQGTFGSLNGDRLIANTVSAEKILVSATDNLNRDPNFNFPTTMWTNVSTEMGADSEKWSTSVTFGAAPRSMKLSPRAVGTIQTSYSATPSDYYEVVPGDSYTSYSMVYSDAGTDPSMTTISQRIYFYDKNKTIIAGVDGNVDVGSISAAQWAVSAWNKVGASGVAKAPANAVYMKPRLTVYRTNGTTPGTRNYYVGSISVMRAMDSTLITPGAIQTPHIKAGAITAESGIIESLNAGVISTGFLDSERLKAGSITTEHLVVADATNFATIDPQRGIDVMYPTNWATQNDGEWTTNKASSESYLFFRDALGPIPFKSGDKFVLKFTGKASAATTGSIRAYFYPTKGSTSGVVMSATQTVALTTTAKEFGPIEFTVPDISAFTGSGVWIVGFYGTNARTISVKNVFLLKMVDSTVIAPESITTAHMQANSITAASGIIKDLDASRISTGSMHGKYIQANTLAAEALAIGSFDNLIPEPEFNNGGASWNLISGTSIIPTGSSTGGPALRITANSSHQSINSKTSYQVSGGESYKLTARFKSSATIPAGSVWIAVRARNRATGVETYPYVTNSASIAANTWTTISDIIEVPDTTDRVVFFISARNTLTTGNLDVEFVSAVRATNTVLIKDGAISASKMELNSITATNGIIASLNASLINYGEMEGKYIKSKTISVDRLLVGSNDNVIPDPQFFNTNNDWGSVSAPYSFPQTEGRDGKAALKIAPSTSQSGRYSARIPVTGGESFRVTVWVKSNIAIPKGSLGIYYNRTLPGSSATGGQSNFLKQSDGSLGNDAIAANTWTMLSAAVTLPENIATVAFGFYVQSTFTTGTVWFSDAAAYRMGDGNLIVDGSITASAIDAGTITVDKLAIGTSDNMVVDPEFEDAKLMDARFKASSTPVVGPVKTSTIDGRKYVTIPVNTSQLSFKLLAKDSNRYSPVVPGATYKIKYQANVTSGTAGTRPAVTRLKADGSTVYTAVNSASFATINSSTWTWVEYEWTAPSDAKAAFFDIQRQAGFTGDLNVMTPSVTRMSSGELIVDGAIDGKTITGALIQTSSTANRGIKLDGVNNKFTAWNTSGVKTFDLNGSTGDVMFLGDYYSDVAGKPRVRISSSLYTTGYAGMTFEADGSASGRVAGIKTSTANDVWKGALFLTSANYPDNGYNTNMSEMRLASDQVSLFVNGNDATQKSHFSLNSYGQVGVETFGAGGGWTTTIRSLDGSPSTEVSQDNSEIYSAVYNSTLMNVSSYQSMGKDDILFSWSNKSTEVYNNNAYVWMHMSGTTPKVSFELLNGMVEMPRIRLTATNDASDTSTLHAFQIGEDTGPRIVMDNNEIVHSNNGAPASLYIPNGVNFNSTVYNMTADGHVMTQGTYKKYVDPTILGSQNLDSMTVTGDYHQNNNTGATAALNYPTTRAGLLEVRNPSGASMIYQRYSTYGSEQGLYTRTKYNSAWTAWVAH